LPSRPPRDRGGVAGNAPGDDRIGPAPDGQTPDTQTPHAQTTADPQAGGGAAPIASRSAVAVVNVTPVLSPAQTAPARPALAATYRVSAMSDSDHLVEVTVANIGDSDVNGWTVIMQLSGLSLVITPGKGALYEQRWREHVFTPTAETAYVPVGASVAFSYTVTGDFASVDGCTIDGYRCG
jgi:hypothetical protein